MKDDAPLSPRARLYDRLPVTDDVEWWCRLADDSPDGRVLELGAGTGRLTRGLADHATVVAVDHDATAIRRLERRVADAAHPVTTHVADVTELDLGERFGLVALPVSLLNEMPTRAGRQRLVAVAAGHCLSDGAVGFALLNPLWLLSGQRSRGTIVGEDGQRVRLDAAHVTVDLWEQRARARLTYRFPDGDQFVDEVDAAAVFPVELVLMLEAVGLRVVEAWGSQPGVAAPAADDGAWHVLARP